MFHFELDLRKSESRLQDLSLEVERQKMQECTFKPHINPLPESYPSKYEQFSNLPFFERVMRWKERKQQEIEQINEEVSKDKFKDCTFKPNINPLVSSSYVDANITGDSQSGSDTIYEKLYQNSFQRKMKLEEQRTKMEEEAIKSDCTFKPQVRTSKSPVQSRYMKDILKNDPVRNQPQVQQIHESECTFRPQINKVNKKFVSGSDQYLSTNAFERLSKLRPKSAGSRLSNDSRSGDENSPDRIRAQSPNPEISFEKFMKRQEYIEQKKKKHLDEIKNSINNGMTFQPEINSNSEKLVKSKADFMHRVKVNIEMQKLKKQAAPLAGEKECTFQPKINHVSKTLPSKSVDQLSIGDWEKMQQHQRLQKQLRERQELEGATFRPKINNNDQVKSVLKVATDPETYLARVKQLQEQNEEKKKALLQERESKEMESCTFKPKTQDVPDFVKRIAKTMHALKKEDTIKQSKPDWK